jgi:hypothetical protein
MEREKGWGNKVSIKDDDGATDEQQQIPKTQQ